MNKQTKLQHAANAERGSLGDLGAVLRETVAPTSPVLLPSFAVATLPAAAAWAGHIVHCTNGAAGQPCLAFSDGTNWKVADGSANVAATGG